MSINNIEIEPPLSVQRLFGLLCLSIALILSISTLTNRRIELKKPELAVELRSLETKVEASSIQEVIPAIAPEKPQKPTEAPKPVEAVQTPPPVVQEPVKPVEQPKPKSTIAGSGSCEAEIYKYDWDHSVALAVARAESGLNPSSLNNNPRTKDYSVGCFQINLYGSNAKSRPSEATLKQASHNVAFAYKIYKSNGSSFNGQWGVCRKISCY